MSARKTVLILTLLVLVITAGSTFAQENSQPVEGVPVLMNTRVHILDRDGREHVINNCFDSDNKPHLVLCSGSFGQSPVYYISKRRIRSIEIDGFTTNMAGCDYGGAVVTLTDGTTRSGFVQVEHAGHAGYRTYEGNSPVGYFMISWIRLKKISFDGTWKKGRLNNAP